MSVLLKTMVCLSTVFGYAGDKHGGRSSTVLTGKPVTAIDIGIAHRTWSIGSIVLVTNLRTNKSFLAMVIDRGPYGKLDADGNWFNARKEREREGTYRGCADLTPLLAKLIGHNQKEHVRLQLLWTTSKE